MFKDIFIKLLHDRKLTAYQMSKDTGISESLISNWKSGRQLPKYDSLIILADYFDISGDYLLGRTDEPVLRKRGNDNIMDIGTVPVPIKTQKTSSSQPDEEIVEQQFIARQYFDIPASAGTGEWLGDEESYSIINVPLTDESRKADFIVRVSGDSMEPKFSNGDKLLVLKAQTLNTGEIGVFVLNGESYVKKLGKNRLMSINPAYNDIPFDKNDTISVVGKVIGRV